MSKGLIFETMIAASAITDGTKYVSNFSWYGESQFGTVDVAEKKERTCGGKSPDTRVILVALYLNNKNLKSECEDLIKRIEELVK